MLSDVRNSEQEDRTAVVIPDFLQVMLWMAGGLTALGVIYLKGLRPLASFIHETERTIPVLRRLTDKLSDPTLIDVIVEMAKQFKTDSGSSLRDVVNRLEDASIEARAVTDILRVNIEGARLLQDVDRSRIDRLLVLLDRIQLQADANTGKIMLAGDTAAALAAGVAADLKESHARATASSESGSGPGESADAFTVSPEEKPKS